MNMHTPEPTGLRLSFLELFEEYGRVEIPLIQRDYAQGRASARPVRDRFLLALRDALVGSKPLSLDFVYGEVKKERGFIPIDGQQRLTTLFLLHWFLACAAGEPEWNSFQAALTENGQPRFRYAIRPSSDRFFAKLLEYKPTDLQQPLRGAIQEQAWCFRRWQHDPTIDGALTMLDEIQRAFVGERKLDRLYSRLTQHEPPLITMDVLNLGSIGLGHSQEKKVQNFINNGVFLYYKTNYNPCLDILLGEVAHLRNSLIKRLISREWSLARVRSERLANTLFFEGHGIKLVRKARDGIAEMYCFLEYREIQIGRTPQSGVREVTIVYPENAETAEFQKSLSDRLNDKAVTADVKAVIRDLCAACVEEMERSEKRTRR